jgi:UPF0042 nucleotide-binding protein
MTALIRVTSFGYGHDDPPAAHLIYDVRVHFRDPHVDPALRHRTARNQQVAATVLATPGVRPLIASMAASALAYAAGPSAGVEVTIAVGCVGGRHRAPTIAETLADVLLAMALDVEVVHRDIDRRVLSR